MNSFASNSNNSQPIQKTIKRVCYLISNHKDEYGLYFPTPFIPCTLTYRNRFKWVPNSEFRFIYTRGYLVWWAPITNVCKIANDSINSQNKLPQEIFDSCYKVSLNIQHNTLCLCLKGIDLWTKKKTKKLTFYQQNVDNFFCSFPFSLHQRIERFVVLMNHKFRCDSYVYVIWLRQWSGRIKANEWDSCQYSINIWLHFIAHVQNNGLWNSFSAGYLECYWCCRFNYRFTCVPFFLRFHFIAAFIICRYNFNLKCIFIV